MNFELDTSIRNLEFKIHNWAKRGRYGTQGPPDGVQIGNHTRLAVALVCRPWLYRDAARGCAHPQDGEPASYRRGARPHRDTALGQSDRGDAAYGQAGHRYR